MSTHKTCNSAAHAPHGPHRGSRCLQGTPPVHLHSPVHPSNAQGAPPAQKPSSSGALLTLFPLSGCPSTSDPLPETPTQALANSLLKRASQDVGLQCGLGGRSHLCSPCPRGDSPS